jgi:hypothetical protein
MSDAGERSSNLPAPAGSPWAFQVGTMLGIPIRIHATFVLILVWFGMAAAVGTDCLVFEAPREDQQAWFIRRFGPDVNLANIQPAAALSLETLRLSLRADTWLAPSACPVAAYPT